MTWIIAAGSCFILFACGPGLQLSQKPPPDSPQLLSMGKKLYENNCIQCHGPNGDGKGWKAAELKVKPRNFTLPLNEWRVSKGDSKKIFDVLKRGLPDTPMAMFHFTDEERWALVYRVMQFSKEANSKEATR